MKWSLPDRLTAVTLGRPGIGEDDGRWARMVDPVREAREELIRVGLRGQVSHGDVVPEVVLRSWRRSIGSSVDRAVPVERFREIDTDTILSRAAEPVLDRWQHRLTDTGTTLFLGDRAGSIVARRTSDRGVRRRLDRAHAAEGFDYSEESVGTNGLGTSMVERRPVMISGSQHYHEALARLACAAAPVCAPTGSVLGSISLSTPVEASNPLMLSLTREIGEQIEERLRADARPQDLALAMSFMRFTSSQRPTVVMDSESILANTPGLPFVDVTSHLVLWELLNAHDWGRQATARFTLEDLALEVMARRVAEGPGSHYVLHFSRLPEIVEPRRPDPTTGADLAAAVATVSTPLPPHAVLLVAGPSGSGRATLARAAHSETRPGRPLHEVVVDGGRLPLGDVLTLLRSDVDVLVRRLERLADDPTEQVRTLLHEHRSLPAPRGALLLTAAEGSGSTLADATVDVVTTRALHATPERVPGLVKAVLDRVDTDGRHSISPAALQAFVQHGWPGGISELVATVESVVRGVPGSVIERRHLPQRLQQAPPRRALTLMESAERDAIIQALAATGGNKSEAASMLGVGRTTLYRRLRQLGLDGDETSL